MIYRRFFHSIMMDIKLKEKFPKWCSDYTQGKYTTCLTDDFDSLLGCAIERYVKGNEINYFYDFKNLYKLDMSNNRKAIGIDMALHQGKSWDNHVTLIHKHDEVNPETANLNAIYNIHRGNYKQKYALSTVITMWGYYGLPLPQSKEGKMILLAIDSGFKGHYDYEFNPIHNQYLEHLGLTELVDTLNHTDYDDYRKIQDKYHLRAKIELDENGYIHTSLPTEQLEGFFNFPIHMPTGRFTPYYRLHSRKSFNSLYNSKSEIEGTLFSFALIGKRKMLYTVA